jgi:hypothetical protein
VSFEIIIINGNNFPRFYKVEKSLPEDENMEKRNDSLLEERLAGLGSMQLVAECGDYSVQGLILGTAAEAQILLTAGLHCDERAGSGSRAGFC